LIPKNYVFPDFGDQELSIGFRGFFPSAKIPWSPKRSGSQVQVVFEAMEDVLTDGASSEGLSLGIQDMPGIWHDIRNLRLLKNV
jgi:hypothetical protein